MAPIGKIPAAGAPGSAREIARDDERPGARAAARGRDGVRRTPHDAGDRLTISPDALRGSADVSDESARRQAGTDGGAGEASAAGAALHGEREALLLARGVADALRADPARAARVHDVLSVPRAQSLLRA